MNMKVLVLWVSVVHAAFTSPKPPYNTESCNSGSSEPGDGSDNCGVSWCMGFRPIDDSVPDNIQNVMT